MTGSNRLFGVWMGWPFPYGWITGAFISVFASVDAVRDDEAHLDYLLAEVGEDDDS